MQQVTTTTTTSIKRASNFPHFHEEQEKKTYWITKSKCKERKQETK